MTLVPTHNLFHAACSNPDRTAIVKDGSTWSYEELFHAALQASALLRADENDLGEQRVAFLIPPGYEYVAVQWGIWMSGGVAVPLGLMHPERELDYVIEDADVSAVVVDPGLRERVNGIAERRSIRLIETTDLAGTRPGESPPDVAPSRRAMILYTSGSTGKPKGVVTTHANILAQVDSLVEAWEWTSSDRILHVLPLHHIHGIINVLSCAMRVGAVCEFQPNFDAERVWDRLAQGNLTLFMAVPTIYAKLIAAYEAAEPDRQQRWSNGAQRLRLMVSGSAALPVPTLETWERITGHRLLERYGMTEIGMALSNSLHGERLPGHVGGPLPGVETRRTNDDGEVVADETPGEIEVRGPNVFAEYWNRPDVTAQSFRDGWFRTGDIAVVDQGAYRILGRSSVDIIKTGGYKVSALEIEDVLRTHPLIRDCAVVGIPDDEWGEVVAVCIAGADGDDLTLESLRTWGKQHLAPYKVPTRLHLCDALPRNAMGKVQKPAVRRLFEPDVA